MSVILNERLFNKSEFNSIAVILPQSYISPKAAIKKSAIHGRGLFAVRPIGKGEVVAIKGGHIMNEEELRKSKALTDVSFFQVEEAFYIGAKSKSEVKKNKLFMNHSCNPNIGIRGQITFVAMRNVDAGEELTFDWAMNCDENYFWKGWKFECNCGDPNCRRVLTGEDWKDKRLQRKYGQYFSSFILEKIHARSRR